MQSDSEFPALKYGLAPYLAFDVKQPQVPNVQVSFPPYLFPERSVVQK